MRRNVFSRTALLVGSLCLALVLPSCGGQEDPPVEDMEGMEGMDGMPGMTDVGDMQRHAEELDEMTPRMRAHLQHMRQLSPEQQHEQMGEHVTLLSEMLTLMNRQLREMDMGMGMSDEQMGEMMGMTGEEHRQMMEEMQAMRADLERLQTAPFEEVREQMPAHLERMEHMIQMMEGSADHMRPR